MRDLGEVLRDADPVRYEPMPHPDAVSRLLDRLRAEIDGNAGDRHVERVRWGTAWGVVAASFACLVMVSTTWLWLREPRPTGPLDSVSGSMQGERLREETSGGAAVPVRHLQFSTPEGIRVFWTFNPDFQEN